MKAEIQCAISFILEQLCSKIPRHQQDLFADELNKSLVDKFNGHWYPESPCKGSGYRCLRIGTREMDAAVATAIQSSGLESGDLTEALPHELSIWVDPGEVSYRMGEKGTVSVIYQEKRPKAAGPSHVQSEPDLTGSGQFNFNPEAEDFLPMTMDSLSSSMRGISLSPVSAMGFQPMVPLGLPAPHHQPLPHPQALHPMPTAVPTPTPVTGKSRLQAAPLSRPSSLTFTAASFAQTKFGSTKLKSTGKKVNFQQLSPTEFANYMKQRSAMKGFRSQRSPSGGRDFPLFQSKDDGFGYWGETTTVPQSYAAGPGFDSQTNLTTQGPESWMLYDSLNASLPSTDQYGHQSLIAAN
ncbi:protein Tob1-like [Acanthaster planci]|uniref:Protein Tob1-like n=1 Tax=Acanthaster planci TaxID=133434 RepID=A0A8B7YW73_ACAPL|nr:protein Tob1-like [Acanthaster planci]